MHGIWGAWSFHSHSGIRRGAPRGASAVRDLPDGPTFAAGRDAVLGVASGTSVIGHFEPSEWRSLRAALAAGVADTATDADADANRARRPGPPGSGPADWLASMWNGDSNRITDLIDGEFALALWDDKQRKLLLIRDPLGRRPLFFASSPTAVMFSSLALPIARWLGRVEADLGRLAEYMLETGERGPASFFRGVQRVEPGHVVEFSGDGTTRSTRWWNPGTDLIDRPVDQTVERLGALFEQAVDRILVTDDRLAAHLSSGLDSSLTVATLAERMAPGRSLVAITGVTDGGDDLASARYLSDESAVAATSAEQWDNVEHRVARSAPHRPTEIIDRHFAVYERPIPNIMNLPWMEATYAAARDLRQTTLIDSSLGNFTMSAYGLARLGELARRGRWRRYYDEWKAYRRGTGGSGAMITARGLTAWLPAVVHDGFAALSGARHFADRSLLNRRHPIVAERLRAARRGGARLRANPALDSGSRVRLRLLRRVDLGSVLLGIRRHFGITIRDPYADRRLVEESLHVRDDHFCFRGVQRYPAKRLLQGRVADSVAENRVIGVQGASWRAAAESERGEFAAEIDKIAADSRLATFFNLDAMRRLLDQWPSTGWEDALQVQLYQGILLRAIAASRFVRWCDAQDAAVRDDS